MSEENRNSAIKPQQIKLELFKKVFRGRSDAVPELWVNQNNNRKGYMPICQNKGIKDKCQIIKKIKNPCKNCNHKEYVPLTDDLLAQHLDGKTTLGVYPLLQDNNCYFIAGDFDNHNGDRDPLADVKAYYNVCQTEKIPCYILRSRSGAGYHAYIFFSDPIPAYKARLMAFSFLKMAGVIGEEAQLSSFDRLFPNQDQLTKEKSLGNLIALPFHGKAVTHGNTMFLDPASDFTTPYPDQNSVLETIAYVSEAEIDQIISGNETHQEKSDSLSQSGVELKTTNGIEQLLECDFIRWCKENQSSVSEPLWFAMISNVARLSPGGHDLCHEFSKNYPKYSYQETEEKIRRALNDTGPHTCQYIKENGFSCGKECGVKSPIVLTRKHAKGSSTKEPALNSKKAQKIKAAIIKMSQREPDKVIQKIRSNQKLMDYLVLLADQYENQFKDAIKQMKANQVDTQELDELIEELESKVQILRDSRRPKIIDMLPNAPIAANLFMPMDWIISYEYGLKKIIEIKDAKGKEPKKVIIEVIQTPIIISSRMVDVTYNKETAQLCYYRDGHWKFLDVEKSLIATTRNISKLADYGIPVNTFNERDLVYYLAEFEKINRGAIPLCRSSRYLGWQDDCQGFLWGRNYLTAETQGQQQCENNIVFRGTDSGNEQIADAFSSRGTYEDWIDAINQLFAYPRVMAGVYFSLGTPLLHILDAPNFTVDWAGGTSTGKTTTLRIAASVWGNPNERSQKSVLFTWDASKVWIERTAAILNGLPLILDDTKLAGKGTVKGSANGLISDILYTIAEGRGRGRGSIEGTQHTGTWRTILLSTGEQSAVDFSMDGGTRARVISLWGPPFSQGDENLAAFIRQITLVVKDNYGHAGPKLINYILSNREQWPIWKQEYQDLQKQFAQKAGKNPVADRVSEYFAFLATIIPIVHAALPELRRNVDPEEITRPLWEAAIGVAEEADRAIAALQLIYDFAAAHQDSFWDVEQQERNQPAGGWLGRWDISKWNFIGFNSQTIEKILLNAGFDVAAIIKTWRDRGYLDTDKTGRGKQVKINKVPSYLYCIKRSAIEAVLKIRGS